MLRAEAGCQGPVLALDVVNDAASRPGQQRRHHEADALAAAGRCKAKDMLGTVMAQIVVGITAEQDAIGAEQAGRTDFPIFRPSSRTVGGDIAGLPRPDDRHEDGGGNGEDTAGRGDGRALHEDRGRIGVKGEPPPEEGGRMVERPTGQIEPGASELGLEAEPERHPLRRRPGHHQNNDEDDGNLPPEYSASTHTGSNRQERRSRSENRCFRERQQQRFGRRATGYDRRQIGRVRAALFQHCASRSIANRILDASGPFSSPGREGSTAGDRDFAATRPPRTGWFQARQGSAEKRHLP